MFCFLFYAKQIFKIIWGGCLWQTLLGTLPECLLLLWKLPSQPHPVPFSKDLLNSRTGPAGWTSRDTGPRGPVTAWTSGFWNSSWLLLGSSMIMWDKGRAAIFMEKQRKTEAERRILSPWRERAQDPCSQLFTSWFNQAGPGLGLWEILLHPLIPLHPLKHSSSPHSSANTLDFSKKILN